MRKLLEIFLAKKPLAMADKTFVIDTNLLVSGFVFKSKKPKQAIERCLLEGNVIASEEIIEEYKSTLLAEKFEPFVPKATREAALSLFIDLCETVVPNEKISACRD